jgi:hypothetical protein
LPDLTEFSRIEGSLWKKSAVLSECRVTLTKTFARASVPRFVDLGETQDQCNAGSVSRIVAEIRRARQRGTLPERFRPAEVRHACPGWADHTYGVFLPKHRRGNPGGYTEYFVQHADGSYSLIR